MGHKTKSGSAGTRTRKSKSINPPTPEKQIIRASSLNKLPQCGGYLSLASTINTSNKYTQSGTLGHAYLEHYVNNGQSKSLSDKWFMSHIKTQEEASEEPGEILEQCHSSLAVIDTFLQGCDFFHSESELGYSFDQFRLLGHCDLVIKHGSKLTIVDYKFYRDPSRLPDITEDLQMGAYALMASDAYSPHVVKVCRLLVRQSINEVVCYDELGIDEVSDRIESVGNWAVSNRDTFRTGDHCSTCLARNQCPAFLKTSEAVEMGMERYRGGELVSAEQVLQVARALPAAKAILDKAEQAVKDWVLKNGPLKDPETRRSYCLSTYQRESVEDGKAVVNELAGLIGVKALLNTIKPSKKMIDDVLRSEKCPQNIIDNVMNKLRREGAITTSPAKRWGWK